MFVKDDLVKVLYCPEDISLNGKLATLLFPAGKPEKQDFNDKWGRHEFSASKYEMSNAYWVAQVEGFEDPMPVFVRHNIAIGDDIVVIHAPVGWKELEGKICRIEAIGGQGCRVRSLRGLPVVVQDYRPLKMMPKPKEGISKEDIAKAAVAIFDAAELTSDAGVGKLLKQLGVNLVDVDVQVDSRVTLRVSQVVDYPKGTGLGDNYAVAKSLATKFKSMPETQLVDCLFRAIENVDV